MSLELKRNYDKFTKYDCSFLLIGNYKGLWISLPFKPKNDAIEWLRERKAVVYLYETIEGKILVA